MPARDLLVCPDFGRLSMTPCLDRAPGDDPSNVQITSLVWPALLAASQSYMTRGNGVAGQPVCVTSVIPGPVLLCPPMGRRIRCSAQPRHDPSFHTPIG